MKKSHKIFYGFLIGIINSFLGSGGGIIAIPILKKEGMSQNKAHANTLFLMLLLSLISAALYFFKGNLEINSALEFIPLGILGSAIGAFIMPKIPSKILRKLFSLFMIWAGVRMIFK